jgi:hypothetical protein
LAFPDEILNPAVWSGAGSAAVGFIAGHLKMRHGRMARLEKEVAECRKRDARVHVLEAGVRMVVGELLHRDPGNPALRMFGDLLAREVGPVNLDLNEFMELLNKVDEADARPAQ